VLAAPPYTPKVESPEGVTEPLAATPTFQPINVKAQKRMYKKSGKTVEVVAHRRAPRTRAKRMPWAELEPVIYGAKERLGLSLPDLMHKFNYTSASVTFWRKQGEGPASLKERIEKFLEESQDIISQKRVPFKEFDAAFRDVQAHTGLSIRKLAARLGYTDTAYHKWRRMGTAPGTAMFNLRTIPVDPKPSVARNPAWLPFSEVEQLFLQVQMLFPSVGMRHLMKKIGYSDTAFYNWRKAGRIPERVQFALKGLLAEESRQALIPEQEQQTTDKVVLVKEHPRHEMRKWRFGEPLTPAVSTSTLPPEQVQQPLESPQEEILTIQDIMSLLATSSQAGNNALTVKLAKMLASKF
jgi:hypothetical protein